MLPITLFTPTAAEEATYRPLRRRGDERRDRRPAVPERFRP
ncbi:MAG: hypothetical protein ACRC50_01450 [Gaiella sp.]